MPIAEQSSGLDGSRDWWSQFIRCTYPVQIRYYVSALRERVLPAFDNLEAEANEHGDRHYQRYCDTCSGEDAAEKAFDQAEFFYSSMSAVRQSLTNLYAVGLGQLFDQQIYDFVSKVPLRSVNCKEGYPSADFRRDKEAIINAGIAITEFASWCCIEELRDACNVVKHAEGRSFQDIKKRRPDLFIHPSFVSTLPSEVAGNFGIELGETGKKLLGYRPSSRVYQPLAGEEVFIDPDDIDVWGRSICEFWEELSRKLLLPSQPA